MTNVIIWHYPNTSSANTASSAILARQPAQSGDDMYHTFLLNLMTNRTMWDYLNTHSAITVSSVI